MGVKLVRIKDSGELIDYKFAMKQNYGYMRIKCYYRGSKHKSIKFEEKFLGHTKVSRIVLLTSLA
jgi:hypothetical protein